MNKNFSRSFRLYHNFLRKKHNSMNQPIKSKRITAFTFSEKKKHFLENLETMDITIKIFGKQLNLALQLQIQMVVTKLYLSKK